MRVLTLRVREGKRRPARSASASATRGPLLANARVEWIAARRSEGQSCTSAAREGETKQSDAHDGSRDDSSHGADDGVSERRQRRGHDLIEDRSACTVREGLSTGWLQRATMRVADGGEARERELERIWLGLLVTSRSSTQSRASSGDGSERVRSVGGAEGGNLSGALPASARPSPAKSKGRRLASRGLAFARRDALHALAFAPASHESTRRLAVSASRAESEPTTLLPGLSPPPRSAHSRLMPRRPRPSR